MMDSLITCIHATLGRPAKALATMYLWQERCHDPALVEWLFAFNNNDGSRFQIMERDKSKDRFTVTSVDLITRHSAPAWNAGASAASGQIFIQLSDDFECPVGWDRSLIEEIHAAGGVSNPIAVKVSDGFRKGDAADLMTIAICTRAYRDAEGVFMDPAFMSMYVDDNYTYRVLRNERDGLCKVVRCPDLVFPHRHYLYDKSVPHDETYAHQNSSEAYTLGKRLFEQKNPRAATDGLKKW